MSKFKYYVIYGPDGIVEATNDEDVAKRISGDDDYFVIDIKNDVLLQSNGDMDKIELGEYPEEE